MTAETSESDKLKARLARTLERIDANIARNPDSTTRVKILSLKNQELFERAQNLATYISRSENRHE